MTAADDYAALDNRDIVTRLRDYDPDTSWAQVVLDAADEIERLRRLPADIAADLRVCALLAEHANSDSCRARAFETAAEIAEARSEGNPVIFPERPIPHRPNGENPLTDLDHAGTENGVVND